MAGLVERKRHLTGRCVLERGHGADVGTAVDGYRAGELIERRDCGGGSAGVGERKRHCAGVELGDTKAEGGNRSQKHSNHWNACMSSVGSTYIRAVVLV